MSSLKPHFQNRNGIVLYNDDEEGSRPPVLEIEQDYDVHQPILEIEGVIESSSCTTGAIGQNGSNVCELISDESEVCCGLCGLIIPYGQLIREHLPTQHADVYADGNVDFEEIPYNSWLHEQQQKTTTTAQDSSRSLTFDKDVSANKAKMQQILLNKCRGIGVRRVSQHRVRTNLMSLSELESALSLKMVEKLGREVPVSLVDKLHAKCGICNAIVSLNKKFETMHLVRHFNAWHPAEHVCSGTWPQKCAKLKTRRRPISSMDFSVADIESEINEALRVQCIWCGMFLDRRTLAVHFKSTHFREIDVPACNLCIQELLLNSCLSEKYGGSFGVTLPDEHNIKTEKFRGIMFKRLESLIKAIEKGAPEIFDEYMIGSHSPGSSAVDPLYKNSQMKLGKRLKPKREFIIPIMRQAVPTNSKFVDPVSLYHWQCKLCGENIMAAVISAGAIKHFSAFHKEALDGLKLDITLARLEKLSGGKMKLTTIHDHSESGPPKIIMQAECSLCIGSGKIPLHEPYNLSRAIRHLKVRHPQVMPEYGAPLGDDEEHEIQTIETDPESKFDDLTAVEMEEGVVYAAEVANMLLMEALHKEYGVEFDKVYSIYGTDVKNQIYVLCNPGDEIDANIVEEIVKISEIESSDQPFVVQYSRE